jgi:hypothetical protein
MGECRPSAIALLANRSVKFAGIWNTCPVPVQTEPSAGGDSKMLSMRFGQ